MKRPYQGKRKMLKIRRNSNESLTDQSFFRLIFSSVMGIILCCICLVGLTWAWFTTSIQSVNNKISSAEFYVTAEVSADGVAVAKTSDESDIYTLKYALEADKAYTVKITAQGNAAQFGGYCEIMLCGADSTNDIVRHTVQLYPSISATQNGARQSEKISEITLTVNSSDIRNTLIIKPTWGDYAAQPTEERLSEGSIIGVPVAIQAIALPTQPTSTAVISTAAISQQPQTSQPTSAPTSAIISETQPTAAVTTTETQNSEQ